jgi:hypothetical protein
VLWCYGNDDVHVCVNECMLTHDTQLTGEMHLGEFVNRFRHGALVMSPTSADTAIATPRLVFGTVSGSIGVVATLTPDVFDLCLRLQKALVEVRMTGVTCHGVCV